MKLRTLILALVLLTFFIEQVHGMPWDTPTTHQWYIQDGTHTVNDYLGYVLDKTKPDTTKSVSVSESGSLQAWWAVRVFAVRSSNATVGLTKGYSINVTRTANGEGLQNVTWTPSTTTLYIGSDAIMVYLYIKIGTADYQHKATFITEHLKTDEIVNSTWTFRLYTERNYSGGVTEGIFRWGTSTYSSRIEDVQLAKLAPWEEMKHHLVNMDLVSFLTSPWTYYIGNFFYGFGLLFLSVTTYNRYQRIQPVIVLFWIFGGTGGLLTMLIPAMGLYLSWVLLALAFAGTLYLLFR